MIPFYLSELARKAQGTLSGEDIEVASVTTDSRNCPPGSLFIALKGEKFDAHDFLEKAVLSGAAALGVSLGGNFSVPCVKCADTFAFYVWSLFRSFGGRETVRQKSVR